MDGIVSAVVGWVCSTVLRYEIFSSGGAIDECAVFARVASLIRWQESFVSIAIRKEFLKRKTDVEWGDSTSAPSTQTLAYVTLSCSNTMAETSRVGDCVAAYSRTDVSSHYTLW